MIVLGSEGGDEETSIAPDRLPLAVVIERTAEEIERVSVLVTKLEDSLIDCPEVEMSTEKIVTHQSVDAIQQSINVLVAFLRSLASQSGSLDIQVATPLSYVSLGDMRERLIHGGEVDVWQIKQGSDVNSSQA